MKRAGNLFDQIADIDNLRLAFHKAKRGKESKDSVMEFSRDIGKNLFTLHYSLLSDQIAFGDYHFFTIYEPKKRLICAASFSERVVHHAIINICQFVFERFQVFDSYATRPGKGQYAALERAKLFHHNYSWFCKMDIRKYFDSIDHALLIHLLSRRFKDKKVMNLFEKIIDSYHTSPGKGLPIGNLTSQYFANFFLAHADHYVKEVLRVKAFVRYMDDMVLWCNKKEEVLSIRDAFLCYLSDHLKLESKPECINSTEKGLPFLGYVLFDTGIRLNKNSKKRFISKLSNYNQLINNGIWNQNEYASHVLPLVAFAKYANTFDLRYKILQKMETGYRAPTA
jgi:retron-type reverse transcriptase